MKQLLLIALLSSCALTMAQEDGYSSVARENADKKSSADKIEEPTDEWSFKSAPKVIKINPLEIVNVVPTLAADFEMGMRGQFISLQAGLGVVPGYLQPIVGTQDRQFDRMGGYVLRFEPRFHIFPGKHHYLSTEFYFRQLQIKDQMAVGMEPDNNEFQSYAYYMYSDMVFQRFSTRMTFKYGFEHVFKNHFALEFYTGLSFRKNSVTSKSRIPDGGELDATRNWNMLEWNLENGYSKMYAIPVVGLKLGFGTKRK